MQVIYYLNENGIPVVKNWIEEQEPKVAAKIFRDIDLLEKYGLALGKPYIDKVDKEEGIWELRTQFGGNIYRQKTPPNEIKTAIKRLKKHLGKR